MQVNFESRTPEATELRDVAIRRLQFKLRRLAWLVPRAKVQLSDVNGPRGGVDKRIHVELTTDTSGTLVATSVARDWRSALEQALARAVRLLVKSMRKGRPTNATPSKRLQLSTDAAN